MVNAAPDRFDVRFDDERAVVNAGIVLPVTLGQRLGIERVVDQRIDLGARRAPRGRGRKVLSLVHAMLLGAGSIDDCDGCAPGAPTKSSVTGRWRRRRSGRSCARSRSGTSVSSTASWPRRCAAPAPAQATSGWSSTLTRSSARSTGTTSRAPATATPASSATNRCWPRGDTGEVRAAAQAARHHAPPVTEFRGWRAHGADSVTRLGSSEPKLARNTASRARSSGPRSALPLLVGFSGELRSRERPTVTTMPIRVVACSASARRASPVPAPSARSRLEPRCLRTGSW